MSYSEVIKEEDGHRVKIILDESPHEPYDDGQSPLIRIEGRYTATAEHVMVGSRPTDDDERIEEAAARWSNDPDLFEKYLRAYHGATQIRWHGPDNYTDYLYVTYDTAAWRAYTGAPAQSVNMDEWISYLNGEVYGYRVEVKAHVYQDRRIHRDHEPFFRAESSEYDEWEEIDSCWGFYGHEYAVEAAEEAFKLAYESRYDK